MRQSYLISTSYYLNINKNMFNREPNDDPGLNELLGEGVGVSDGGGGGGAILSIGGCGSIGGCVVPGIIPSPEGGIIPSRFSRGGICTLG